MGQKPSRTMTNGAGHVDGAVPWNECHTIGGLFLGHDIQQGSVRATARSPS